MEETTTDDFASATEKSMELPQSEITTGFIVILFVIGIFGIIGNSMTCIILLRWKIWTSVNLLIGIMAISDLGVIPSVAVPMYQSYLAHSEYPDEVVKYVRHIFMSGSIVSAILIGFERALAIRQPLNFKEKWTPKLSMKIFIVAFSIFIAFGGIRFLIARITGPWYFEDNFYIPYFVIVRGVPFVLILAANIMITLGLMANSRQLTSSMSESANRRRIKTETTITRTMFVLTSVYFFCMVTSRILHGVSRSGVFGEKNNLVVTLAVILEQMNYSVNIIIYTTTSKAYRREYVKLLRFCFCVKEGQSSRDVPRDANL